MLSTTDESADSSFSADPSSWGTRPLSDPLQTGVRFLPRPFPAASSASFAVRLPSRGSNGVTSFTFSIAPGSGRAFRPVVRHPRQGTLQPLDLTTYRFGPSLTASWAGLFLRPLSALHLS